MATLKELRKRAELTQNEVCELFEPPIPVSTWAKWENGHSQPPAWAINLIKEKIIFFILKQKKC